MRAAAKSVAVAAAASLSLLTAACGSNDNSDRGQASNTSTSAAVDPSADLVGPGCADYVTELPEGVASVRDFGQESIAVAASKNPRLTSLVAAVSGKLNKDVDLVETLNGSEFTVFAPVNSAFAKLDKATVATLGTPGGTTLSSVLTYHVIPGLIPPDDIVGTLKSLNGAELAVTGSGDYIKVGDQASVICGGIKTSNSTIYLIDTVLMPPVA